MNRTLFFCLAFACLFAPLAVMAQDDQLSDAERGELIELYEASRSQLEHLAARAAGDSWTWKPDPETWSVGEVIEHVVLAEEGLMTMITGALADDEDPEWEQLASAKVSDLVAGLQDRTQKFPAPPQFVPTGELDRDALLRRFGATRTTTIDFARRADGPIKRHTASGPAGKMNVHQWLGLIAAHHLRHNLQIEEVLDAMSAAEASAAAP